MRTLMVSVLTALALTGAGCVPAAPATPPSAVSFESTVMLSVGKSLTFEDGLKATLTRVDDSRCKEGVVCIWQGELSPQIELSGGALSASATAVLGTERGKTAVAGIYTITLVDATETTATFTVTVAE